MMSALFPDIEEEVLSMILTSHDGDVNAAAEFLLATSARPDGRTFSARAPIVTQSADKPHGSTPQASDAGTRRRAPIPKDQQGDGSVTNASHIYDCALANKLLPPGTLPKEQQRALDRFLTSTPNLQSRPAPAPGATLAGIRTATTCSTARS
jgi:hypothetical protein